MTKPPPRVYVDISWRTLFKIIALGVGIFVVILLRDVLEMLFAVFIFVAAVNPTISRLQRHMSRLLAVTLFYVLFAAGISLISALLIPSFIHQLNQLIGAVPLISGKIEPMLLRLQSSHQYSQVVNHAFGSVANNLQLLSDNFVQTTYGVVGGIALTLSGIVLSFYLLLEERNAREFFHQILPQNRYEAVYHTVSKISERMGSWIRGELLLMLIIGASNLLVYLVIGLKTPLPLATWAGLCELIPVLGPVMGVIPALVVSLSEGNILQAILVFAGSILLIQQLEAHIVVPKVMGKAVGLSPVLVILALLIGAKLFGLAGALISLPTAAVISVIVGEWPSLRKLWEESSLTE